jgi:hypothetical protein
MAAYEFDIISKFMYKYLYENYAEQKHKITGIKTVITSQ